MRIEPEKLDKIKRLLRAKAGKYLDMPNINSVGIGKKIYTKTGPSDDICIQFTVDKKIATPESNKFEELNTFLIKPEIELGDFKIPTDIIERKFVPTYIIVPEYTENHRKVRQKIVSPGLSVSNINGTAGTIACIVYDKNNQSPYVLSNWHVLQGDGNDLGDPIVQPGPYDDNEDVTQNIMGHLVRSHLGAAGDCAVGTIENRDMERIIYDLDIVPIQIAKVELDDKVIKSGRTTGVTYGIVTRIEVLSNIDYGGSTGSRNIGGFEIGPDPEYPAPQNEISMGGDSGALWMIRDDNGDATDIAVGLHFAGETSLSPEEFALACNIHAVLRKLDITLVAPKPNEVTQPIDAIQYRNGYDPVFTGIDIPLPGFKPNLLDHVLDINGGHFLDYVHYSLAMHTERRLAIITAHNIDGTNMKVVEREDNWLFDSRIGQEYQTGNEAYRNNPWDRGHLVRRAAVVWGSLHEARMANEDSFHYTNAAPQHQNFNRDEWLHLEDWVLDRANEDYYKLCVFTGPVFTDEDEYTGYVSIPRAFWKVIAMRTGEDAHLSVTAFLMNQYWFMEDRRGRRYLELRLYQVDLDTIEEFTDLTFSNDMKAASPREIMEATKVAKALPEGVTARQFSVVTRPGDIII